MYLRSKTLGRHLLRSQYLTGPTHSSISRVFRLPTIFLLQKTLVSLLLKAPGSFPVKFVSKQSPNDIISPTPFWQWAVILALPISYVNRCINGCTSQFLL